jgi:hypothetical protein
MKRQIFAVAAVAVTVLGGATASMAAPTKAATKATAPKAAVEKPAAKTKEVAAVSEAPAPAEVTYKFESRQAGNNSGDDGVSNIVTGGLVKGRSEWIILKILNGKQVKILHTTRVAGMLGNSRWFDHKPIALRVCVADSFDVTDSKKNCTSVKSDTIDLPAGKSIYDLSFDIRYIEGGHPAINTVQLSPDMKPEPPEKK